MKTGVVRSAVAKYRKRPVVIEAEQWFPGKKIDGVVYCTKQVPTFDEFDSPWQAFMGIKTLEGDMEVRAGDWVITGVMGEKYPCRDDIFKQTYEEVIDER